MASGQRGWKRQPVGGSARLGGAPVEAFLRRGVADPRQAGDQVRGVGMARRAEDVGGAALLDQPAGIHDAEPVGEVGVHRHVVGDEDHRGADLALHLADHRQHALLHDDVERRGRLVGDDELGPADAWRARSSRAGACRPRARADRRRARRARAAGAADGRARCRGTPASAGRCGGRRNRRRSGAPGAPGSARSSSPAGCRTGAASGCRAARRGRRVDVDPAVR